MSPQFYVPADQSERILASGRPLAPRTTVEISAEDMKDPHNKRLLEEGKLIKVDTPKKKGDDQ